MSLFIRIPGRPIPQERPYVTRHGTYDRKRSKDAKKVIAQYALAALCDTKKNNLGHDFTGKVDIVMRFFGARNNADLDNLIKLCLDSIQGVLFDNDAQVWAIAAYKLPANDGKEYTEIEVTGS